VHSTKTKKTLGPRDVTRTVERLLAISDVRRSDPTSMNGCRLFCLFAKNWSHGILGLLQHNPTESGRSIVFIMRNPPPATGFQTRISASLSTMMTGSPSGNCPGYATASASGVFEPPSSGIEMRAGVSAASQVHTAIARTGRATGTPARPTTAMRKSANRYCSNLGSTGYE
jgi:hypothetical protein